MNHPTLEVLISTCGDGIHRVAAMLQAPRPDVGYVVSWQSDGASAGLYYGSPAVPAGLAERADVRVVTMKGRGLSRNRNNALRHAVAPLLLLADDDETFLPDAFDRLIDAFRRQPEASVLLFRVRTPDGRSPRPYPPALCDYARRPRGTYVNSVEVAFRRSTILPPFSEQMGLGAPMLGCGEEEVFVHQVWQRGGIVRYVPIVIAVTDDATTGRRLLIDRKVQAAKGAVLRLMHGRVGALLRVAKTAILAPRGHRRTMWHAMCDGMRAAREVRHEVWSAHLFAPLPDARPQCTFTAETGPQLAVVIACYNRAATLPRLFASLAATTWRPLHVVLVDNTSTDATPALCRRFADHAPQGMTVICTTCAKRGAAAARNMGLQQVTAPWVYFFDSDDELSPRFFDDVMAAVQQTDVDMVCARTRMVFADGREKARTVFRRGGACDQLLTGMLGTQGMVFRTAFLRRIGGWNEALPVWNDWELGLRALLARPRRVWLSATYHRLYQHPDSLTGSGFAPRLPHLTLALEAALSAIHHAAATSSPSSSPSSPSAERRLRSAYFSALYARVAILSGHLRREGHPAAARRLMQRFAALPLRRPRFVYKMLAFLTARGLPGTWALARRLC